MKATAWLAVQALDGTEAYTRGGSLDVSPTATLVTTRRPHRARRRRADRGAARHRRSRSPPTARSAPPTRNGRSTSIGQLKLVTPEGAADARHRRPVPRRRRRARRPTRLARVAGRRARRLERQRGRGDGRDDRRARQFEMQMKLAAERRRQRQGRRAAALDELIAPRASAARSEMAAIRASFPRVVEAHRRPPSAQH